MKRPNETGLNIIDRWGKPLRLRAVRIGQLAATLVHRGGGWTISHIDTGRTFPVSFPSRRNAVAAARELDTAFNWQEQVSRAVLGIDAPWDMVQEIRRVGVKHRGKVPFWFGSPA